MFFGPEGRPLRFSASVHRADFQKEAGMPQTKPSIVFCHGIWADGSCFSKVIPTLQAEGHEVMAVQYGLDTLAGDVAAAKRTLGRGRRPAILRGHAYRGAAVTRATTEHLDR